MTNAPLTSPDPIPAPTFLACLPAVMGTTTERCLRSMFPDLLGWDETNIDGGGMAWLPGAGAVPSSLGLRPDEVILVDNTWGYEFQEFGRMDLPGGLRVYRDPDGHNLGVARSWNVVAREVIAREIDWFVILSASMLYGPELHTTFRREVEAHPDAPIVECMGNSWHLIAIARSTLEHVGLFDENFYPAYWEATDWGARARMLGYEDRGWPRVWCNAMSIGHAVHVDQSRWEAPSCPARPLTDYYVEKWGGMSPDEVYVRPFGVPSNALDWWPDRTIAELAAAYGLEVWW